MGKNKTLFNDLWTRNIQGQLTAAESAALRHMVASGEYKAEIDALMQKAIEGDNADVPVPEDASTRMFAQVMRQRDALDNVPVYTSRRRLIRTSWAMAAGIAIMAMAALWLVTGDGLREQTPVAQNTVWTGKRYMHLPDGTAVTMNEGSTLTYSPTFGDSIREVLLEGEAFFVVAHDAAHPFIVRTAEGINTTVLGTAFNVRAYPDQATTTVTVERGKVRVGTSAGELALLTPEQEVTVQRQTLVAAQTVVKVDEAIAWRKPLLIIDGVSMQEAATLIAQRFGVSVKIGNDEFQACQISLSFMNNESVEEVLTTIDDVTGSTHTVVDGVYTITGSCSNK